jgi:hypothetical protein
MKITCAATAAIAVLGCAWGCGSEEGPLRPIEQAAVQQPVLEQLAEVGCNLQTPPPPVEVKLVQFEQGPVDFEATAGLNLELRISNATKQVGELTLRAMVATEAGEVWRDLGSIEIESADTSTRALNIDKLLLPRVPQEWSGLVRISGRVTLADGTQFSSKSKMFHFHPTERGWRLYDDLGLAHWNSGALSTKAQIFSSKVKEGALSASGVHTNAVRVATFSVGRKVSDSTDYRPME